LTLIGRRDLLSAVPRDAPGLRVLMHEAARLRCALTALFAATRSGSLLPSDAAHTIDRALRAGRTAYSLDVSGDRPRVRVTLEAVPLDARAGGRSSPRWTGIGPLSLLNPLARSALELAEAVDPTRLRPCAAPDCGRWFVDTSKGGRRKWCSMERCGNRAKAARYRSRHAD
ncbi:MAG: CGNR zinc finger domain-containing protein, partial [Gemmatimonadota bacterium]|nr:CGNR zinc finger domain-containing protein [Gemmatimonadota bacterium]